MTNESPASMIAKIETYGFQCEAGPLHNCVDWQALRTAVLDQAADPVVEANRALLRQRSQAGIAKYGTTLAAAGCTRRELVQHALEEALDLANYLQADLQVLDRAPVIAGQQARRRGMTAMVDAAMVEMANIAPPLRRSECQRLINAALGAARPTSDQQAAGSVEAERAAFEKAARNITHADEFTHENDGYDDYVLDTYWRFWQARAALDSRAQPVAAESAADKFCDANCVWTDHAPGCAYGTDRAQSVAADTVPMPQNADQAALMSLLGTQWLQQNAPERLRQPVAAGELPPLPKAEHSYQASSDSEFASNWKSAYTADQMRAYGQQCADSRPVAAGELPLLEQAIAALFAEQKAACATDPMLALKEMARDSESVEVSAQLLRSLFATAYGQQCATTAPWLTLAHTICADAGIPPGRIDDRLAALRDVLDSRPASVAEFLAAQRPLDADAARILHENIEELYTTDEPAATLAASVAPEWNEDDKREQEYFDRWPDQASVAQPAACDLSKRLRAHDDERLYQEADVLMSQAADEIDRLSASAVQAGAEPAHRLRPIPFAAIDKVLAEVMNLASENGANSISMPDEYVEVADFLYHPDEFASPAAVPDDVAKDAARWRAFRSRDEYTDLEYSDFKDQFRTDADELIDQYIDHPGAPTTEGAEHE